MQKFEAVLLYSPDLSSTNLKEQEGFFEDQINDHKGTIKAKENAVLCGIDLAVTTFKTIDNKIKIISKKADGKKIKKGSVILKIKGNTRSILIAERTALNFLGLMSGIATKSKIYSDIARPHGVKIYSTRKTIAGIRDLEKYALTKGGAYINRLSLDDFFFIKDNHLKNVKNI